MHLLALHATMAMPKEGGRSNGTFHTRQWRMLPQGWSMERVRFSIMPSVRLLVRANIDARRYWGQILRPPSRLFPSKTKGCAWWFFSPFFLPLDHSWSSLIMQAMLITHMRVKSWSREDPGQTAADPCFLTLVALVRIKCNSVAFLTLHLAYSVRSTFSSFC